MKFKCAKCRKKNLGKNQVKILWYYGLGYIHKKNNPRLCWACYGKWVDYYNHVLKPNNKTSTEEWCKGFDKWIGRKWTPSDWRIA